MMSAGPLGIDTNSCSSVGDALEARVHMIARLAPLLEGLLAQQQHTQQQSLASALSPPSSFPPHLQTSSLALSGPTQCPSPSAALPSALGDRSRVLGSATATGELESMSASNASNSLATAWIGALAALMQSQTQDGGAHSTADQTSSAQADREISTTAATAMLE